VADFEDGASADEADVSERIARYADELRAAGAIRSPQVERAFRTVQRHRMLETFYYRDAGGRVTVDHDPGRLRRDHLELIYADTALATRYIDGRPASSTSQASLVARMLELLDLRPGMKVLEVGAGTGYNAALMAEIVGDQRLVVTVDVLEDVVDQTARLLSAAGYPGIRVLLRDGFAGVPADAPFDRIVATVGCSDLSPHWAGQLAGDGTMLVPLEHADGHPLVLVGNHDGALRGRVVLWTGFMPVRGPLQMSGEGWADGLWSRGIARADPADVVHEPDPEPRFGPPGPDKPQVSGDDESDFLFFLGLADRRACSAPQGVGLTNGLDGWATVARDGIRWWKDAALAAELDRHYRDWDARGRPAVGEYQVSFLPIGTAGDPPPGGWQITRRFYRELVTLGVRPESTQGAGARTQDRSA
jgi:protein-L-isoaspartate(D-aspartate) O-methyltransferase